MSDDMIMLLIRLAIIILPTGITCFIAGFLYGRSTAYHEIEEWKEGYWHGDEPRLPPKAPSEPVRTTRLTSRDKTLEI